MFRTRPPRYAAICIGLWFVQFGLTLSAFHHLPNVAKNARSGWELATLGISLILGILLIAQLPRALQWRPRLTRRPSAEVCAERKRIARDLHDNVGSQLVCALALLDGQRAQDAALHSLLEKSMLDLRLLVDSMDGVSEPFLDRLARLRHRIKPALERRGIHLFWDMCTLAPTDQIHTEGATQLLAILQEALSNVLQHSQATVVVVGVQYLPNSRTWYTEVSDNGQGVGQNLSDTEIVSGRGIAGMRERARLAGGQLRILQQHEGGICVWAVLPGQGRRIQPVDATH